MVHLVPCCGFINGEHWGIQNRLERMRPKGAGPHGCGGEASAQDGKLK